MYIYICPAPFMCAETPNEIRNAYICTKTQYSMDRLDLCIPRVRTRILHIFRHACCAESHGDKNVIPKANKVKLRVYTAITQNVALVGDCCISRIVGGYSYLYMERDSNSNCLFTSCSNKSSQSTLIGI